MKVILCYGDSNTWGFDPATQERFPPEVRWTGVLAGELGPGFRVIEEGLSGRTTVWDDPVEGLHKNGRTYLLPCLESHQPIDLVVLMLGTNDLKQRFSVPAVDIAGGAGVLIDLIQKSAAGPGEQAPRVLLLAPPPVGRIGEWAEMFAGAQEKSRRFAENYRLIATEYGCDFLDAGEIVVSCDQDGIHLEADQHLKLGGAVANYIREIFPARSAA
jgi:lysophospholipase L1-like esterase